MDIPFPGLGSHSLAFVIRSQRRKPSATEPLRPRKKDSRLLDQDGRDRSKCEGYRSPPILPSCCLSLTFLTRDGPHSQPFRSPTENWNAGTALAMIRRPTLPSDWLSHHHHDHDRHHNHHQQPPTLFVSLCPADRFSQPPSQLPQRFCMTTKDSSPCVVSSLY